MNNRICEILGIEKPVIQAPMVWLREAIISTPAVKSYSKPYLMNE